MGCDQFFLKNYVKSSSRDTHPNNFPSIKNSCFLPAIKFIHPSISSLTKFISKLSKIKFNQIKIRSSFLAKSELT
ncbi:hypothetical protein O181_101220 [Austropuccinia psidii MF-1]|uniref:Uncharacterized protein n=1 Tax=Austropuccinia psidii MF-1 TaxID=1389203 RepID=A0A9Q3JH49_9BASI|nr:hypothetical protein [Austropuccinia psidii MF-1]